MGLNNYNEVDSNEEAKKRSFKLLSGAVICVCLLIGGALLSMRAYPQWFGDSEQIDLNNNNGYVLEEPVIIPVPTVDSKTTEEPRKQEKPASRFVFPGEGEIIKEFSHATPIYSKTLDQYVVHLGVDIGGNLDSKVYAAAEGTVTFVGQDDKQGILIEITHSDGFITRYGNLSTDKMVEEGDVVSQGDVISGMGNSSIFESLDPPHVHFEILKNGIAVDPNVYLK